jgi:hypothetical protein
MAVCHPITLLAPKAAQQPAAVQDGSALPVEDLPRLRPNGLRSVNSFLQAEYGALASQIDRCLDRAARLNGYRIEWTR